MPDPFHTSSQSSDALSDERIFGRQLRKGTIGLSLGFGVPALILCAVILYLIRSAEWVDQTDQVMADVRGIEKQMIDAETGTRGFQLTGDEQFIRPFASAREEVLRRLDSLSARLPKFPTQIPEAVALRKEVGDWFQFAEEVRASRRTGADGTGGVEVNLRGKTVMDAIRERLERMYLFERDLRTQRVQFLRTFRIGILSALAALGLAGAPIAALWLRRFVRELSGFYKKSVLAAEQHASELQVTLRSIGDAVVATNARGEVVFLNPVAERLMGWTSAEAQGRALAEVFPIFNEQTGARTENPVDRVLRERVVVGLANHTVLRARDGRETPIEDSAAPILGDDGEVLGVILVFHDVAEKRGAEIALLESEARFRFLNLVGEATRELTSAPEIMAKVAECLGQHLHVSRCAYADVAADGDSFTIQVDYVDGCASIVGSYRLEDFGPQPGVELRAGRTLVIEHASAENHLPERLAAFRGIEVEAAIACPLVKEDGLRAFMAVHQKTPRVWHPAEIALVEEVVERCWAIIERARAEAALREGARLSALRAEIGSQLASDADLDEILQRCSEALVQHLDAAFARIWTIAPGEPVLELRASAGIYTHLDGAHARVPVGQFKIGRIAQNKQPHLTNDVAHDSNISDPGWARANGMVAFAGYPLMVEGRVLGVLALFARQVLSPAVLGDLAPVADSIAQCLERQLAEAALYASEVLKSAIIHTSLDGFILMTHEGRIADWNAAAERIFAVPKTAAVGRLLGDVVVPERLRERHTQGVARYVATREARILGQRYELPAIRGDGSEFPCEISITHIAGTEPPLFAGFVRDITERKSAAEALTASEARLRFMAESMPQKIFTATVTGDVDYFNQQWMEFTGLSFEQIRDWGWRQFIHPDDLEGNVRKWRHSIETGEPFQFEHRFRRADGAWRWHLSRAQPMRDAAGGVLMWIGSNTDVDDVKRSEQEAEHARAAAEAASKAKDDFLAALSHELRTPLTPVLMIAATLRQDERLPAEVREQLSMVERNVALEARLIDDLLDLTRIAKGKLALRLQACDAHSLIGLAVEIVRDDARGKGIALRREFAARRSGLMADPARFQQVIWNLLRNAVKFTPRDGQIEIRTRDSASSTGAAQLRIEVSDSGIGIAPGVLDTIFLPFEQAGLVNDHRFGGMGLGLAIARAIVDLHGGTISAESAGPNRGATFVVELPGATEPPSGVTPETELSSQPLLPGAVAPAPKTSLRLLLVEDHEPTLQVLSRLLTRAGHRIRTASMIGDALQLAAAEEFDAVISDLGLPDGTGTDLMRELHERYGLRGIALSGYGMEEDLARSREAGFLLHLVKPVDFNQLEYALRELEAAK